MQKYFSRSPNTLHAAEAIPRKADTEALSIGCLLCCTVQGEAASVLGTQAGSGCEPSPRDQCDLLLWF